MLRNSKWEMFIKLAYCLRDSVDDKQDSYVYEWDVLEDFEKDALCLLDGVNVTTSTETGRLVLERAIETDSVLVVNAVLDKGVDLNGYVDFKEAPLSLAVGSRGLNAVYFDNPDKNASTTAAQIREKYTALHFAVSNGNIAIVKSLIDQGADLSITTDRGRTALHIAAYSGNLELVQSLLYEIKRKSDQMALNVTKEEVKLVSNNNADLGSNVCNIINLQDEDGWSALHVASSRQSSDIVNSLLNHGTDVALKTTSNETPLHTTIRFSDECKILELLLDEAVIAGMKHDEITTFDIINSLNLEGNSAFHMSIFLNKIDMARTLISYGADLSKKDQNELYDIAIGSLIRKTNTDIVKSILYNEIVSDTSDAEFKLDITKIRKRINDRDEAGRTALHYAVGLNPPHDDSALKVVRILLDCGAYFDIPDNNGVTPLHIAVGHSLEITELLLASKANHSLHDNCKSFTKRKFNNINAQNNDGDTALHIVARFGRRKISIYLLKELLHHGADLRIKNKLGLTEFQIALQNVIETSKQECHYCWNKSVGIVYLLVREEIKRYTNSNNLLRNYDAIMRKLDGLDVNKKLIENIFLKHAIENDDEDMVTCLIKCGAILDVSNISIASDALHTAIKKGQIHIIISVFNVQWMEVHKHKQIKCNSKINIEFQDCFGDSLLHTALRNNKISIAKFLISHGSNVNLETWEGFSALHIAAKNGQTEIIEMLLHGNQEQDEANLIRTNADINSRDSNGETPLHSASQHGFTGVIKSLLIFGADLYIKSEQGKTPLHHAVNPVNCKVSNVVVVDLLLQEASKSTEISVAEYVNMADNEGNTALHIALKSVNADFELVKTLLRYGSDLYKINYTRQSSLQLALRNTNKTLFKLLINEGIDVNAADGRGWTPLIIAAKYCNSSTVEEILDAGADVAMKGEKGRTALHYAGSGDVVDLLLSRGANINEQSSDGSTPLHYVIRGNRILDIDNKHGVIDALLVASYRFDIEDTLGNTVLCSLCCCGLCHVLSIYRAAHIMRHITGIVSSNQWLYDIKSNFHKTCREEVKKIKLSLIDGICLYDILNYNLNKTSFTKLDSLRNYLHRDEFKSDFPIYWQLIRRRFDQAKRMRALLDEVSANFYYSLLNTLVLNVPMEVVRMILSKVNPPDLMSLEEALRC